MDEEDEDDEDETAETCAAVVDDCGEEDGDEDSRNRYGILAEVL